MDVKCQPKCNLIITTTINNVKKHNYYHSAESALGNEL